MIPKGKTVQVVFKHSIRVFKAQETCMPNIPNEWGNVTAEIDYPYAVTFRKPKFSACIVPWNMIERIDVDESEAPVKKGAA